MSGHRRPRRRRLRKPNCTGAATEEQLWILWRDLVAAFADFLADERQAIAMGKTRTTRMLSVIRAFLADNGVKAVSVEGMRTGLAGLAEAAAQHLQELADDAAAAELVEHAMSMPFTLSGGDDPNKS